MNLNGISIIVCTRDREVDLQRCCMSIESALKGVKGKRELILVDDGFLQPKFVRSIRNRLSSCRCKFVYINKSENPGLLLSRKMGLSRAMNDVILFVDDDVVLDNRYIQTLFEKYDSLPEVAGIGGIDILARERRGSLRLFLRSFLDRLFLLNSGSPGKLSVSAYNFSMASWIYQHEDFYSEFLSGCNMSFRRKMLVDLKVPSVFAGYSVGEDVYISITASRRGRLLVCPDLKVKHYYSVGLRDDRVGLAYSQIVNTFYLMQFRQARWIHYLAFFWTQLAVMLFALSGEIRRFPRGSAVRVFRSCARGIFDVAFRRLSL